MDSALDLDRYAIGQEEEEDWEETARYKLQAMMASGNRNAKEAVERFVGWQKRRGNFRGVVFVRSISYSDVLMRIQVRELSDLARMGIEPAIRSLEEVRVAKLTRQRGIKQLVDQNHRKIIGEFST